MFVLLVILGAMALVVGLVVWRLYPRERSWTMFIVFPWGRVEVQVKQVSAHEWVTIEDVKENGIEIPKGTKLGQGSGFSLSLGEARPGMIKEEDDEG